jgi:signal transduction histidine kinase
VIADSHRASEIVARIRAMVRKAPPHKEWIDINDALESAIALAHAEASKHRIELLSRLSEDIPPICVDKIQIQQVVLNLVVNAIEAMRGPVGEDEGLRKLIVSSERYDSQAVRIRVRDSGAGLPPERVDEIFQAFYTTKPEGLGMGLAVSRSIVEAHRGRLWATPNDDRGATFQFTLPVGGREVS